MFKELKNRIKEAIAQEEEERQLEALMMKDAMNTDPNSEEYKKLEAILKSFMEFRPKATVGEFYQHFENRSDFQECNPFLPLVIASKLNAGRA